MTKDEFTCFLSPRPVVIVTTVDSQGRINAAPVTWHSPVSYEPPIVSIALKLKPFVPHTLTNILHIGKFVLNQVPLGFEDAVDMCSQRFPEGVNELEKAQLKWISIPGFIVPRILGSEYTPWDNWMACTLYNNVSIGDHRVIFGQVVDFGLNEECFNGLLYKKGRDFARVS